MAGFEFNFGENDGEAREAGNPSGEQPGNSGSSGTGSANTGQNRKDASSEPVTSSIGPATKRRGRKPLPRDANGNIIRTAGAAQGGTATKGKLAVSFNPNDRDKVRQQIQGIHAAAATLTRQPLFLLSDMEANGLTDSLCDVLDYHNINLTEKGGAGGLYLALGLTVFGIYKPRLDAIRKGVGTQINATPAKPSNPADAATVVSGGGRMMDFTSDIDNSSTQH